MKYMPKAAIIVLIFALTGFGQEENGVLNFKSDEIWVITLNDSLHVLSSDTLKLHAGTYYIKARPQISYNWPARFISDSLHVYAHKTTTYILNKKTTQAESSIKPLVTEPLPYEPTFRLIPESEKNTTLKGGLLVTAIAANWLAFYLNREADKSYDKYLNASSSGAINKYWDQAQTLDTATQTLVGISAGALLGYIYLIWAEEEPIAVD